MSAQEVPAGYELSVVRAGAYMRCLENRTVIADPATLVCSNQGEVFRLAQHMGQPARETVISVDEATFRALLAEADPRGSDRMLPRFPADSLSLTGPIALCHAGLLRARTEDDPIALQELALDLARWSVQRSTRASTPEARITRRATDAVQHTRSILATRHSERLTLDGLARAAGLTPWHLSRVFRAATGESVHQYLLRIRLHRGLECVALGENNLARIALECGFSSHSHFTSAFRRAFGCSPSSASRYLSSRRLDLLTPQSEVQPGWFAPR